MKNVTKHVYAQYNEYSTDGILYTLINEGCAGYYEKSDNHKYICDVVIPEVDKSFIVECAVSEIDMDNARLQARIETNNTKKQQLLCIEHNEDKDNE